MDSPNEITLEEIIGNIIGGVEIPPIGELPYMHFVICSGNFKAHLCFLDPVIFASNVFLQIRT